MQMSVHGLGFNCDTGNCKGDWRWHLCLLGLGKELSVCVSDRHLFSEQQVRFFFFFFWASVQVDFEMCLPCSAFQQIERTVEKGSYVLLAKSAGMTCKMMLQNQNIFQPSDQLLAVQLNDAEQKVVCSRGPSRAFKRLQETSYALLTRASSTVQLVHDHPSLHRVVRGRG
jgi:hypothetical protein